MKRKTTQQKLTALIKDINSMHGIAPALLAERLLKISELTKKGVENNPAKFAGLVHPKTWISLCDIIDQHLKYE